jgi:hypothetical protein
MLNAEGMGMSVAVSGVFQTGLLKNAIRQMDVKSEF